MNVIIYHNRRCSKSRATLAILEEKGVPLEIVEYLKTPPSKSDLSKILDKLGMEPRDLMRKNEGRYQALNLADKTLDHGSLIDAMVENPILIERPVVVNGDKCVLCRPPENVLEIL